MRFDLGETIGIFDVKSGRLIVSDPCYERGTWCSGGISPVKNGKWEARAHFKDYGKGLGGRRVARLVVFHRDHPETRSLPEPTTFEVGVDSGQAGFFDDDIYPISEDRQDAGGRWGSDEFYDACCDATIKRNYGIIYGGGVVTTSGWGDGGYECQTFSENGKIVAAQITFISEEDE